MVLGTRWLDHFVICVNSLESSGSDWEKLGFQVLPPMRHIEFGSSNRVIQLRNNYIELYSDFQSISTPYKEHYSGRLAIGEGLANASFSSEALEIDRHEMIASGYSTTPVLSARRPVSMPDGQSVETDSDFFYAWRPGANYMTPFWSVHRNRSAIFVPEYQQHPNTAIDIVGMTCFSRDLQTDAKFFALASGGRLRSIADGIRLELARGHWVEIYTPDAAARMFGDATSAIIDCVQGMGLALTLEVSSLAACRAALAPDVSVRDVNGGILVSASQASGTVVYFIER